jgi:hypothetical protein
MKYLTTIARVLPWFWIAYSPSPSCPASSVFVSARPSLLQEQNENYLMNLVRGAHVGVETLLSLLGYYEENVVEECKSLTADACSMNTLIIDAAKNVNDQTHIQIAGLGLGRTGTTSLVMALEMLGYTVIHDDEQPELVDLYAAEGRGDIGEDEFHEILGLRGYNATFKTDYEWVAQRPNIKAILTVRDNPDKYVDSWLVAAPFVDLMKQRPFCWMKTVQILMPDFEAEFMYETTDGKPEDYLVRDKLRDRYVEYVRKVQDTIPSENLLTFNVKEGWKPLCDFLEISTTSMGGVCPEDGVVPFPHVHTRSKLQGEMYFLELITWIWPLAIIIPLAILKVICSKLLGSIG